MIIEQLKEKLSELQHSLNAKQQQMLSLKSIENFLLFYDKIHVHREQVLKLLIAYFDTAEEYNYIVDKSVSNALVFDYVMKIGTYYTNELGFKIQMKLQFVLMVGLHTDAALLLIGVLKKVYYIPVTTVSLFARWWYLKVFYEKRHMVHNIRF